MRFMTALRRCRRTSSATRRAVFDCFAAFRPGTREPPAVALRRARVRTRARRRKPTRKGGPEPPLSDGELDDEFAEPAGPVIGRRAAERLFAEIRLEPAREPRARGLKLRLSGDRGTNRRRTACRMRCLRRRRTCAL